ncbi:MAG: hypothetical protein WCF85_07640 [Rhodospirillaceae bacterium]
MNMLTGIAGLLAVGMIAAGPSSVRAENTDRPVVHLRDEAPYTVVCWQNGREILNERDVQSIETVGPVTRLHSGTGLRSIVFAGFGGDAVCTAYSAPGVPPRPDRSH